MFHSRGLVDRPKFPFTSRSDSHDYLVIGIDFGTTFSGVAWATNADFERNHVNVITSWPGTGREEGKAPTELSYESDELEWGFGIHPDSDPVRWFKLLLLKEEDISPQIRQHEYVLRARRQLAESNKSPVDAVADYLRLLWQHVLQTITKARSKSVVESLPFHIVLTVPAIWKGYARQGMERAARQAGMLDHRPAGQTILSFAPEPEAAALSTLSEPGQVGKKDSLYLVCDAGGGTVDLITYRIASTDPIRMHEAVEGMGDLCGGIFIDQDFEGICKQRLGRKWNKLSRAGVKDILTHEWQERIKPQFKPDENKEYIVRMPPEIFVNESQDDLTKEPHIKKGRIHFKSCHIEQAFAPIFGRIRRLIDAQVMKASKQGLFITAVILVGGLGGSPYLFDHLQEKYSMSRMEILQSRGMNPRTAICRGAVLKGFLDGVNGGLEENEPTAGPMIAITSTIARASLGIKYRPTWDDENMSNLKIQRYGMQTMTYGEQRVKWIGTSRRAKVSPKRPPYLPDTEIAIRAILGESSVSTSSTVRMDPRQRDAPLASKPYALSVV